MPIRPTVSLMAAALLLAACQQPAPDPQLETEPSGQPPPAAEAPVPSRRQAPEGARVYFISPMDGASVTNPVRVMFGLQGMGVAPAGVDLPNTGHHHLLIDAELGALDAPIPADAQHVHFGGGQTETGLTLAPGEHRLQLVLGDYLHVPHDPPVSSDPITIRVE